MSADDERGFVGPADAAPTESMAEANISVGRCKDGRPFAEGNTRDDGDYRVGKNRPPEHSRFRVGDSRRRGRRPKGQRNFDKDWEYELARTVQLTRDGKPMRVTAHRAQVMTAMSLAAKGRERSQELVFRKAGELADRKQAIQSQSDDALIAEWFAQQQATVDPSGPTIIVGDDAKGPEQSCSTDRDRADSVNEGGDDPQ